MEAIADYLTKTRSATQALFRGVDELVTPIRQHQPPIFVGWGDSLEPFLQWSSEHADEIAADLEAQRKFVAELHAIDVLSGSILQVAYHAISSCSTNTRIPTGLTHCLKAESKVVRFCIGRMVKGVPLGVAVYVGRNQHMHHEAAELLPPTRALFEAILGSPHERDLSRLVLDEMLIVEPREPRSLAKAFLDLLCWRSNEDFERDMITCLGHA